MRGSLALAVAVAAGLVGLGSARGAAGDVCPPPVAAAETTANASVTYPAGSVLVGPKVAQLGALIDAGGSSQVTYLVEYGTSPDYGLCTPTVALQPGSGPQSAPVTLTGLASATSYHFRVIAQTDAGSTVGPDRVFTTLPAGEIPQGTTIDGIRVGGMRRLDALAAVHRLIEAPARLAFGKRRWTVARWKLGTHLNPRSAVQAALKGMPGGNLTAPITVDSHRLTNYLTAVNRRLRRAPQQAALRLAGQHAVVQPAEPGAEIAPAHARWAVTAYLKRAQHGILRLPQRAIPASHATDRKAVVIRLQSQSLTAYRNGKVVLRTPVTTGRLALPTPVGTFAIQSRYSPYTFISPWPKGNPYYYPPTPVTWAMYFYDNDFLHDDPAEPASAFGPGSQNGPYASHGCVHVPHDAMAFLYKWLPIGATVIVSQT